MTDPKFLRLDYQAVQQVIQKLLADYPELAEDEELLKDMIDGESDFTKVIERLVAEYAEASDFASVIKEREKALTERRGRYEAKADAMKALMLQLMQQSQQTKVTLYEATVSVLKPRASVRVDDVNVLTQPYFKLERSADKKRIREDLENGLTVEGASLEYGEAGLSIRTR